MSIFKSKLYFVVVYKIFGMFYNTVYFRHNFVYKMVLFVPILSIKCLFLSMKKVIVNGLSYQRYHYHSVRGEVRVV